MKWTSCHNRRSKSAAHTARTTRAEKEANVRNEREMTRELEQWHCCRLRLAIAAFLDMATINQHKDFAKSGRTKY